MLKVVQVKIQENGSCKKKNSKHARPIETMDQLIEMRFNFIPRVHKPIKKLGFQIYFT